MLAIKLTDVNVLLNIASILILIGVAATAIRTGRHREADGAREALLKAYKEGEEFWREKSVELEAQVNQMQGELNAMKAENKELRSLIMGETVPSALQKYLDEIAGDTALRIERHIDEVLANRQVDGLVEFDDGTSGRLSGTVSEKPKRGGEK